LAAVDNIEEILIATVDKELGSVMVDLQCDSSGNANMAAKVIDQIAAIKKFLASKEAELQAESNLTMGTDDFIDQFGEEHYKDAGKCPLCLSELDNKRYCNICMMS